MNQYPQSPPQGAQYPPQGTQSPPQGTQYPPQGTQYPPQGTQYPPQGTQYPPQGGFTPYGAPYPYQYTPQGYRPMQPPYAAYPPYGQSASYAPRSHIPVYAAPRVAAPAAPVRTAPDKKERRRRWILGISACVIVLCLLATLLLALVPTAESAVPNYAPGEAPTITVHEVPELTDDGISTVAISQKVGPSVVTVLLYPPVGNEPFTGGSGILMSEDGLIITNAHVVAGEARIMVELSDDTEHEARVVGTDEKTDLAVLRIDAEGLALTPAEFGDSNLVQIGERCVAIGNAAGLFPGSVTQGIVSGLGRQLDFGDGTKGLNLIQTDAALNPGNSGGALVNRFGQVVGITSSKIADLYTEGLCFAIPMQDAKPVLENLIQYGYVKDRAVLGVVVVPLNSLSGPTDGLPAQGLLITIIEPYSDLPLHGVVEGDVIVKAGGIVTHTPQDLTDLLKTLKPGDTLELEILKPDTGRLLTVQSTLTASPQP